MEPAHGVVNLWGRLAQAKWALTAICSVAAVLGRCRVRIQQLLRLAPIRTFRDQFVSWGESL
jgi:hypothetical protein